MNSIEWLELVQININYILDDLNDFDKELTKNRLEMMKKYINEATYLIKKNEKI